MLPTIRSPFPLSKFRLPLAILLIFFLGIAPLRADNVSPRNLPPLSSAFAKVTPETVKDLKAIQERVKAVVEKVTPAVVGVKIGNGQGSGVIISEDGYILTAAHVCGPAGRQVTIIFPNGKKVKGKTVGADRDVDAGMIKITTKGKWPYVEMGDSNKLKRGNWCIAIGHPKGFIPGRTPVVRLGRVLDPLKGLIRTDCTLVGGDSGGPLFDMNGKVIGIHSRIGPSITYNIHVPVNRFNDPWLGVQGNGDAKVCRIHKVYEDSPAAKAGIKDDDVIVSFAGKVIVDFEDLVNAVAEERAGNRVAVVLNREGIEITLMVTLGRKIR